MDVGKPRRQSDIMACVKVDRVEPIWALLEKEWKTEEKSQKVDPPLKCNNY